MIPLLLLLSAACPSYAAVGTSTAACDAVAACAAKLAKTEAEAWSCVDGFCGPKNGTMMDLRSVPVDALPHVAPYAAAAYRAQRCAWAAETRAIGAAAEAAILRPIRLCPTPDAVTCPVCEERPRYVDALSHGGACVACAGLSALGGWAACRGGL
jgi:hypothetical protein